MDLTASFSRLAQHYLRGRVAWNRLFHAISYLRSALWFVPFLSIIAVLLSAPVLRWIDRWLGWHITGLGLSGARSLCETVITLSLSFMVFTFSSLLVAIQVAGGQLTPRIIATTLLRDNVVRVSVGLFVFTLVFSVMTLNRLETIVLDIATAFVAVLGIASIAAFLFLIDHAARLLRPVSIVTRVGDDGIHVITAVYGDRSDDSRDLQAPDALPEGPSRVVTHQGRAGIVLAVDQQALVAEAHFADGLIECVAQVGDFVADDDPLLRLHGRAVALDDDRVRDAVAIGAERTMEQDPLFAFRILVDIGLKALSPAINDPTTAVLAVDQVHRLLKAVGLRRLHSDVIHDAQRRPRLLQRTPDWEDFVRIASTEIRASGAGQVQVARRVRAMLENLVATLPEHRHPALIDERDRWDRAIDRAYPTEDERALARVADSQGLGAALTHSRADR